MKLSACKLCEGRLGICGWQGQHENGAQAQAILLSGAVLPVTWWQDCTAARLTNRPCSQVRNAAQSTQPCQPGSCRKPVQFTGMRGWLTLAVLELIWTVSPAARFQHAGAHSSCTSAHHPIDSNPMLECYRTCHR